MGSQNPNNHTTQTTAIDSTTLSIRWSAQTMNNQFIFPIKARFLSSRKPRLAAYADKNQKNEDLRKNLTDLLARCDNNPLRQWFQMRATGSSATNLGRTGRIKEEKWFPQHFPRRLHCCLQGNQSWDPTAPISSRAPESPVTVHVCPTRSLRVSAIRVHSENYE